MKKKLCMVCIIGLLCFSLTGCKSSDYKDAVKLQTSGDYSAALKLYNGLDGYKDSSERKVECQNYVTEIENFDKAKKIVESANTALNKEIKNSEDIVEGKETALDETLRPTLETAISETKAFKVDVPEMPKTLDGIKAETEKLNGIDYSSVEAKLQEANTALDTSIKQYALVNNPSEGYVIECLRKVNNIVDISAVTEDNDPNGNLNKAGGYTAQIYFSSDLVNQNEVTGNTVIDKGTDCGGSIEVYATPEDAQKRSDYLAAYDGTILASGSHTVIGTVLVRTSNKLKASEQKTMEANIVQSLTTIK